MLLALNRILSLLVSMLLLLEDDSKLDDVEADDDGLGYCIHPLLSQEFLHLAWAPAGQV